VTALDDTPTKAGRREWLGLAVLALPTFIVAIDLFVLLLALPNLASDLHAGANQQLWITDIYGFVLAGFLVTMGTLGDRIGRRKLLIIGSLAFGIGSIACAYAPNAETLIVARALLGIAGATLMPSTMALIATLFPNPKQMATAFGIWAATFTLGAIFGPVIGGVMLAHFWWGSVFLLGVPIMLALVIVGPKLLPEFKNPAAGKIDPTSVLFSLLALLPTIYGIKELAKEGIELFPAASLLIGIGFGIAFVRRQNRIESPLLDMSLLRNRTIGGSIVGMLCYTSFGGGLLMLMLLYFQLVGGLTSVQAGAALVPGMVTGAIGFQVMPKLAARFRPSYVMAGGMIAAAMAFVTMTQVDADSGNLPLIIAFAASSLVGVAMPGLGANLIVGSAPPEQAGSAGSLAQMANEFGSTLGLAIYGTIGAAVYRAAVVLPAGLPAGTAAEAGDSVSGAAGSAAGLSPAAADALMAPAREAFVTGLNTVATIGIVVLVAAAAFVGIRMRHVPPFGQAAAAPAES
jgi:DHA2 family multidrug resistance protein-like MFS transporter